MRVSRAGLSLCAALLVMTWATSALASGVVIISDSRAAQYREALEAAKQLIQDATEVDVTRPNLEELLKRARPSVVLAIGRSALALALRALPTTPIVHCAVLGPPSAPNVTGVRLEPSAGLHLARFSEIHPGAKRIGVLYDPGVSAPLLEEARRAASTLHLSLVARAVTAPDQVKAAIDELATTVQAFWILPSPRLLRRDGVDALIEHAIGRQRPLFGFLEGLTRQGALASISTDYRESGREAALLVQRILARPSTQSQLPPPVAAPARVTINLGTSERLGIVVPARAIATAHRLFR